MKKKKLWWLALSCLILSSCVQTKNKTRNIESTTSIKGTDVFKPNWENIAENYQFPQWFKDAKFGIFIHWGLFSVPSYGSEWYPLNMYTKGSDAYNHHIKTFGPHTEFGYKDFIPLFKAENFDADQWVDVVLASGAKYIVPVAEHHDGFALYDSQVNPWNSVEMGPKKDFIQLLKDASQRKGLIFGLSSHRLENDWFFNGGLEFPSDVQDSTITLYGRRAQREDYTPEIAKAWLEHTYELVDKYQPELIWFDWTVNHPEVVPYFNKFLAYYYNNALDWDKQVVVNTKEGYPTNVQVWDVERGKSGNLMQYPWQTDTSVGKRAWGYIEGEDYKTSEQIVHDLVDIVSKNGNLLLNIGPKPDGTIPDEQKEVLYGIGNWLKINGEGIYDTSPWIKYGEGSTTGTKGSFTDNQATPYTTEDIRFTTKGNNLYVTVLSWGDNDILVRSLEPKVIENSKLLGVEMLGSNEVIEWLETQEGLKLKFPKAKPCEYAYTFKLRFDSPVGRHLEPETTNETFKHG